MSDNVTASTSSTQPSASRRLFDTGQASAVKMREARTNPARTHAVSPDRPPAIGTSRMGERLTVRGHLGGGDPWDPGNPENRERSRRLTRELRERLLVDWDPIGVGSAPAAQDEYDGYVSPILHMLHRGEPAAQIEAYLVEVVEERMGLCARPGLERQVAESLIAWWAASTRVSGDALYYHLTLGLEHSYLQRRSVRSITEGEVGG